MSADLTSDVKNIYIYIENKSFTKVNPKVFDVIFPRKIVLLRVILLKVVEISRNVNSTSFGVINFNAPKVTLVYDPVKVSLHVSG